MLPPFSYWVSNPGPEHIRLFGFTRQQNSVSIYSGVRSSTGTVFQARSHEENQFCLPGQLLVTNSSGGKWGTWKNPSHLFFSWSCDLRRKCKISPKREENTQKKNDARDRSKTPPKTAFLSNSGEIKGKLWTLTLEVYHICNSEKPLSPPPNLLIYADEIWPLNFAVKIRDNSRVHIWLKCTVVASIDDEGSGT